MVLCNETITEDLMIEAALLCLTTAVYFEARGEPLDGQYAVAQVIVQRMESDGFPNSVCGVVNQKNSRGKCQFSFVCDRKSLTMREEDAKEVAKEVATDVLTGYRNPELDGALFFHTANTKPYWAKVFTVKDRIGNHIFYAMD